MTQLFALVRDGALVTRIDPATQREVPVCSADKGLLQGEAIKGDKILPVVDEELAAGLVLTHEQAPTLKVAGKNVLRVHRSRPETTDDRTRAARTARAGAYPDIGSQLDAIMKGFAAYAAGEPLPPDTLAWIEACQAVKAANPKP